jgi:nuclear inhibitor of protein phosphatase 1
LQNLTEFNTAHNKRVAQLVDMNAGVGGSAPVQVRRKKKSVVFIEEVDIINPEDIDPSIGRFRNMISTSIVIPNKVVF